MNKFSYYWNGQRQTRTDDKYLQQLTDGHKDKERIIEGIKASKEAFNASHTSG